MNKITKFVLRRIAQDVDVNWIDNNRVQIYIHKKISQIIKNNEDDHSLYFLVEHKKDKIKLNFFKYYILVTLTDFGKETINLMKL